MFIERFGLAEDVDDVMRYADFLREEAGLTVDPPIDLARIYERFGIPTPERAPLPGQQGLLVNPDSGLILINEDDPDVRQRFSEAHELMEFLFSALPSGRGWAARQAGVFKSSAKENLCNECAAELLMPRATFAPRVFQKGVSYQTARLLASEYQVSVSAALVRVARVGQGRHVVVLWRLKNKPKEVRNKVSPNQFTLFGDALQALPPKKLRVEWSMGGPATPYIPPDKSVPEDCSIYEAWQNGVFTAGEDNLDLSTISGLFRCENKPFDNQGERFVLSLLHLPSDAECGPHLQD
jgi:hypothetical protein